MKTKFEVLALNKKAIAKLNDQQIMAVKGGREVGVCVFKTSTINCNTQGATVIQVPPPSAD